MIDKCKIIQSAGPFPNCLYLRNNVLLQSTYFVILISTIRITQRLIFRTSTSRLVSFFLQINPTAVLHWKLQERIANWHTSLANGSKATLRRQYSISASRVRASNYSTSLERLYCTVKLKFRYALGTNARRPGILYLPRLFLLYGQKRSRAPPVQHSRNYQYSFVSFQSERKLDHVR